MLWAWYNRADSCAVFFTASSSPSTFGNYSSVLKHLPWRNWNKTLVGGAFFFSTPTLPRLLSLFPAHLSGGTDPSASCKPYQSYCPLIWATFSIHLALLPAWVSFIALTPGSPSPLSAFTFLHIGQVLPASTCGTCFRERAGVKWGSMSASVHGWLITSDEWMWFFSLSLYV